MTSSAMVVRGKHGHFAKGVSGNPSGGTMTAGMREAAMLAREHAPKAVRRLIALSEQDQDRAVALRATEYLLNRVYGAPTQPVIVDGERPCDVSLVAQAAMLQEALRAIAELTAPQPEQPAEP